MLKKKKAILIALSLVMSCNFINGFSIAMADEIEGQNLTVEESQYYDSTYSQIIWGEDSSYIWSENKCTINGITFDINSEDNKVSISKADTDLTGTLILPNKIKVNNIYYNVASIRYKAFCQCNNLIEVFIPENVQRIEAESFIQCENLERISIPSTVTKLEVMNGYSYTSDVVFGHQTYYYYFVNNCPKLKNIDVNSNNNYFSSQDGVLYNKQKTDLMLYPKGKEDTYFKIPEQVTNIREEAFNKCDNLTEIELSNSIQSLGYKPFSKCSNLEFVYIGSNLQTINPEAFSECYNLESFIVDSNNQTFSDIDGILFNKTKTKLIKYPCNRSDKAYSIPNSVKSTDQYAFLYCKNLKSIAVPDISANDYSNLIYLPNPRQLDCVWTIPSDKIQYQSGMMWCPPPTVIESNLYNREDYTDDVIKIKADSVECIEKLRNGQEKYRSVSLSNDGYFIHEPSKNTSGTRYYYYKAIKDGKEYISPVISVTVKPENVEEQPSLPPVWNNENKCLINTIEYAKNSDGTVRVCGNDEASGDVVIPQTITVDNIDYTVKSIDDNVFANCTSLTSINIPNSVETIGKCAFAQCSNLTEVILPDNLKNIEWFAFENCISLREITIPSSTESIDDRVFWYCIGMRNVMLEGYDISIGSGSFFACSNCLFKVRN